MEQESLPSPETALLTAVRRAGSQSAMGRALGVTQRAVWRWVHVKKELPPEHVLAVEAATGVSRHELRPDIYPLKDAEPKPLLGLFESIR